MSIMFVIEMYAETKYRYTSHWSAFRANFRVDERRRARTFDDFLQSIKWEGEVIFKKRL